MDDTQRIPGLHSREEVFYFTSMMESTLRQNDFKGHWKGLTPEYLSRKLTEEFAELQNELLHCIKASEFDEKKAERVRDECIDLANVCMMIADNTKKVWT
jgi:hypothetical protein